MRITAKTATTAATIAALFSLYACATPTPAAAPSATPTPVPTLGPTGYGALTLGLTKAEARATGLAEQISENATGGCGDATDGHLKGAAPTEESMSGRLFFSTNTNKLVAIYAYGSIATPEGLHVGSTASELRAAYPAWQGEENVDGIGSIPVPGNDKASYRVDLENKVLVELSLDASNQDCYE